MGTRQYGLLGLGARTANNQKQVFAKTILVFPEEYIFYIDQKLEFENLT
jgi:hypothetical protein